MKATEKLCKYHKKFNTKSKFNIVFNNNNNNNSNSKLILPMYQKFTVFLCELFLKF